MSDDDRQAGRVIAIGERVRIEGFALAGAVLAPAEDAAAIDAAWAAVGADVSLLLLTPAVAAALAARLAARPRLAWVTIPA